LIDIDGHIKFTDFGFAKIINGTRSSFCGTPQYMAPEIIGRMEYTQAVDWWSFGIVCYELIAGYSPFHSNTSVKVYSKIMKGEITWSSKIGGEAKKFLSSFFKFDPNERAGSHGGAEFVKSMEYLRSIPWHLVANRAIDPPFIPELGDEDVEVDGECLKTMSINMPTQSKTL
jgi:serine/threonine protein kinase